MSLQLRQSSIGYRARFYFSILAEAEPVDASDCRFRRPEQEWCPRGWLQPSDGFRAGDRPRYWDAYARPLGAPSGISLANSNAAVSA
jgi:hypothetical protein